MYPHCHPSLLTSKDLQPRPPPPPAIRIHHLHITHHQGLFSPNSLSGFTCFLFLHSAQGPEPPVAKGGVESRLHLAGVCRQHGHRAPFRPHGQRAFCHRTGNSPSSQTPFSSFRRRALQRQRTCTLRESARVENHPHKTPRDNASFALVKPPRGTR